MLCECDIGVVGVCFLTADSEHVIIPRTENTIKCKETWALSFLAYGH